VYFWSNENYEPIHVHVSKGKPFQNATKIWLTRDGGCILASNGSNIPSKEQGWKIPFAAAIKREVSIPVAATGVIRDPAYAEKILTDDDVDFVAMGRS
jgi:2,4-dienoyl-CoA reductase-like NADH-dependent reductase (Old Yellow Enzyme family)